MSYSEKNIELIYELSSHCQVIRMVIGSEKGHSINNIYTSVNVSIHR